MIPLEVGDLVKVVYADKKDLAYWGRYGIILEVKENQLTGWSDCNIYRVFWMDRQRLGTYPIFSWENRSFIEKIE